MQAQPALPAQLCCMSSSACTLHAAAQQSVQPYRHQQLISKRNSASLCGEPSAQVTSSMLAQKMHHHKAALMGAVGWLRLQLCCLVCAQVAWNKAELSAHDMQPEQQERLFAGKR